MLHKQSQSQSSWAVERLVARRERRSIIRCVRVILFTNKSQGALSNTSSRAHSLSLRELHSALSTSIHAHMQTSLARTLSLSRRSAALTFAHWHTFGCHHCPPLRAPIHLSIVSSIAGRPSVSSLVVFAFVLSQWLSERESENERVDTRVHKELPKVVVVVLFYSLCVCFFPRSKFNLTYTDSSIYIPYT